MHTESNLIAGHESEILKQTRFQIVRTIRRARNRDTHGAATGVVPDLVWAPLGLVCHRMLWGRFHIRNEVLSLTAASTYSDFVFNIRERY